MKNRRMIFLLIMGTLLLSPMMNAEGEANRGSNLTDYGHHHHQTPEGLPIGLQLEKISPQDVPPSLEERAERDMRGSEEMKQGLREDNLQVRDHAEYFRISVSRDSSEYFKKRVKRE